MATARFPGLIAGRSASGKLTPVLALLNQQHDGAIQAALDAIPPSKIGKSGPHMLYNAVPAEPRVCVVHLPDDGGGEASQDAVRAAAAAGARAMREVGVTDARVDLPHLGAAAEGAVVGTHAFERFTPAGSRRAALRCSPAFARDAGVGAAEEWRRGGVFFIFSSNSESLRLMF